MDINTQSSPESDGFFRSALAFGGYSGYAASLLILPQVPNVLTKLKAKANYWCILNLLN